MRPLILAIAAIMLAVPAYAEEPTAPARLNQAWIVLNAAMEGMQAALGPYEAEAQAVRRAAADSQARLKWVLDNWVQKTDDKK